VCVLTFNTSAFEELQHRTEKINNSYSIPSYYYAPYLVSLQEDVYIKPVVKAIALVDIEEQFWQQPVGRAILQTSNKQSIRIFAFNSEKDFNRFYETLKSHSLHYTVLAISNKNLLDILGNYYARDFSIIRSSVDGSRLLALYEDTDNNLIHKDICFSCDLDTIDKHEDKFNQILKYAINISSTADEIEDLSKRIFQSLTTYSKKPIEMSAYIDISDYDQHEEEHAYYQEMMQYMIDVSIRHSKQLKQESVKVLELGAGTGIFTVRIINQIKNLSQLDIIEIDWHCFHILKHKIRQSFPIHQIISEHADKLEIDITHNSRTSRINVYHKDSREYDPEGQFDYVFSSFADHHIRSSDKQKYFTNVKNNVYHDGLFIVGDEFLRRYDSNDKQDRELALRNYHDHIIEIATNEGHYILARLEELALDSGLKETGDFKVSCQEYETHLERSGFIFDQPKKIGPLDLDGIGGVYVYQCRLKR
jgi:phospholipid N-methyltransferase